MILYTDGFERGRMIVTRNKGVLLLTFWQTERPK
jgi:hypothetical protein